MPVPSVEWAFFVTVTFLTHNNIKKFKKKLVNCLKIY